MHTSTPSQTNLVGGSTSLIHIFREVGATVTTGQGWEFDKQITNATPAKSPTLASLCFLLNDLKLFSLKCCDSFFDRKPFSSFRLSRV